MVARRRVEDSLQFRVNGDAERRAGLLLTHEEHVLHAEPAQSLIAAFAKMLTAHTHNIAAALCSVEPELEREAGLAADRMRGPELRDLVLSPDVMAVRRRCLELDA